MFQIHTEPLVINLEQIENVKRFLSHGDRNTKLALNKGHVKSISNRRVCMKKIMKLVEADDMSQDHGKL